MAKKSDELSYDTQTLIVVLALIFAYPIGLILMFAWMKWKIWVKILLSLPIILVLFTVFIIFISVALVAVGS